MTGENRGSFGEEFAPLRKRDAIPLTRLFACARLVPVDPRKVANRPGVGQMPKAKVNGINIYYKVHGQGEPLVLITGMGADHRSWFRQVSDFQRYYQVITFDSRGIGKTDRPTELYSFKTLADDVIGLMDHLALDKAHLLGLSLGGIVAQEIAIDHPDRVRKLVLVNTSTGRSGEMDKVHPALMEAYGLEDGSTEIDISKVNIGKSMSAYISLSFNKVLYRMVMLLMARLYVKPSGFEGMAEQLKAISTHSTLDRLHLIKAATLVIAGTDDKIVPPRFSEVLASRIPNATLVSVEDGSHALHVEMKSRFNREVLDFLRDA